MNATLQTLTEERMNVLKDAIMASVRRTPLSINGVMEKLAGARIDWDYNRAIVEHVLGEMEREGEITRSGSAVMWNHRRELCNQDDSTHHCKCCGSGIFHGVGDVRKCPACV